jgi:hypothetical protein
MNANELPVIKKPKTTQDLPWAEGQKWGNCFVIKRGQSSCTYAHFKEGVNLYVGFDENDKVVGMWRIE